MFFSRKIIRKRAVCAVLFLVCAGAVLCWAGEEPRLGKASGAEASERKFAGGTIYAVWGIAHAAQRTAFAGYQTFLDAELAGNRLREPGSACLRELVSSDYVFSETLEGWLRTRYDADGIFQMELRLRTTASWLQEKAGNASDPEEKTEAERFWVFRLFLLEDGSQYIVCGARGKSLQEDLPACIVCEDALRYYRMDPYLSGVREEGEPSSEEAWQDAFAQQTDEELEYWYREGKLYAVDRQAGTLSDVTEGPELCIAAFLEQQPPRAAQQLNMDRERAVQVEGLFPTDYFSLYDWRNYAACDLNSDGQMDYVVALYPKDYPPERRYADFSPYEHNAAYYASQFWLLLSDGEREYQRIPLSNSVEYPEEALVLVTIAFEREGLLRLEYFVGRSPWYTATLLFEYREPEKTGGGSYFYLVRSYYHNTQNALIGDAQNYGSLGILSYFGENPVRPFREGVQSVGRDLPVGEGKVLSFYWEHRYSSHNIWEEQMVNSQLWRREAELLRAAQKTFSQGDFVLSGDPVFWNSRIVSNEEDLCVGDPKTVVPNMVDRKTGEAVNVTELIGKEEFLRLFASYAYHYDTDKMRQDPLSEKERTALLDFLEENWDTADSLDVLTAFSGREICLQIAQTGLLIGVRGDSQYYLDYCHIDKEHFVGTPLWYYLAPEWMLDE